MLIMPFKLIYIYVGGAAEAAVFHGLPATAADHTAAVFRTAAVLPPATR